MRRFLCQLASKQIKYYFYRRLPNETIHKEQHNQATLNCHPVIISTISSLRLSESWQLVCMEEADNTSGQRQRLHVLPGCLRLSDGVH